MKEILRNSRLLVIAIVVFLPLLAQAYNRNKPKYLREDNKALRKLIHYASDNRVVAKV